MQKLKTNEIIHVTESVLRSLAQNRITTIVDFLQEDVTKLCTITKLILTQVLDIRNDIFKKYAAPLRNGTTLLINKSKKNLSTGLERLDNLLEGGIPIGYISELCGLADSGKTQLCFQLAVNCVTHSERTVLYVDTKGDFSAVRIQKMLETSGLTHKEMALIMYRIKIVHVWTLEETLELLKNIKNKAIELENLAMIIVDSLPCLMFQFLGDDSKIGLTMLSTFVNYSRYLCKELKICMLCVNIQTRWVDQDIADIDDEGDITSKEMFIEKRTRCLGKYWQQIPYLVLSLEKTQDNTEEQNNSSFILKLLKCNNTKKQSMQCIVNVSEFGIT